MKVVAAFALVSTIGVAFARRYEMRSAEQRVADRVREARVRHLAALGNPPADIARQTGLTPADVDTVLAANPTRRRLDGRAQAQPATFPFA
ncbi:MAG: hypothetical protein ACR2OG_09765 [Gemmatimonadaceae bacterium]